MAKKRANSKPRRVSRREVLLLAPAAFVTGAAGDRRGEGGGVPCGPVQVYVGDNPIIGSNNSRKIFAGVMCCDDGAHVFVQGHKNAENPVRQHLQALRRELDMRQANGELLEYCVMAWGVTEGGRDALLKQLKLSPYQKK